MHCGNLVLIRSIKEWHIFNFSNPKYSSIQTFKRQWFYKFNKIILFCPPNGSIEMHRDVTNSKLIYCGFFLNEHPGNIKIINVLAFLVFYYHGSSNLFQQLYSMFIDILQKSKYHYRLRLDCRKVSKFFVQKPQNFLRSIW